MPGSKSLSHAVRERHTDSTTRAAGDDLCPLPDLYRRNEAPLMIEVHQRGRWRRAMLLATRGEDGRWRAYTYVSLKDGTTQPRWFDQDACRPQR
jgi:hypothetical protein